MTEQLLDTINYIAVYSIVISAFLIWKDSKIIRGAFVILAFLACVCSYLIIEDIDYLALKHVMIAGPLLLPFTFWLFSKSLFNDETMPARQVLLYLGLTLFVYYGIYILNGLGYSKLVAIPSRILSVFFVILALRESLVGKEADLDDDRIKLRKYFIYFIGFLVVTTLLVELGLSKSDQLYPRILQRASIVLLNSLFILSNFSITSRLLSKKKKKPEIHNPELIERIQSVMQGDQLYRKEKLTISQLAESVNEQEYKVRRAINQELGYRNFIDFTNSFRIKEATDLLKDNTKTDLTILEIAYQTGFNSIGPFNRVFKIATGFTPTEYRKRNQSS